ncbi:MAG: HAMP domain-containing histidine kinase [Chloroflexi bacterium]|nr:HAMP domain-containing histidine kinase [Chloroflexota bacterium]
MFSSLRSRLWLSYALLIVTALGVVAAVLFVSLLRNPLMYRQTTEKLKAVQTTLVQRENQDFSAAARRAARVFDVRVLLYSNDKQLILDTSSASEVPLPFPGKKIIARDVPLVRNENGAAWLYVTEKLPDKTFLVVAAPRPRFSIINLFTDDFLPLIIQSGLIALLLSLAVAFLFARWIADPLQKVILAARGMPSAETKPVDVRGPHEVQELTRAFNSMIARTQASQKSQRDFVANVSHELKTPLTSVQGFAQAILDGTADTEESRQQAAQVIYDEAGRMHRLALDLLDLARLDAGTADITMSPVNLPALLNAVREKFMPQSQKAGVEINVEFAPNLPTINADGDRLSQVFTNLVDNALRFTPGGGLILLRAAGVGEEVLVSVSDTGAGIPDEALARIFDRFYQADPARSGAGKRGSGLGLAIVHEIVQAHGGRIGVRSRLGEGTTFEIFLPLRKQTGKQVNRL